MIRLTITGIAVWLLCVTLSPAQDREQIRWLRQEPAITKITIDGNHYFTDDKITDRMYSRSADLWRKLKDDRRVRVRRESPRRDSLEITYLYLTQGFLDAQVTMEYLPRAADSSAEIIVRIEEGRQYSYGQTSVVGTFLPRFASDFRKIADRLEPGKPVNPFQIRQAEFDIKSVLANNGYPYAFVSHRMDSINEFGLTPVTFAVYQDSLVKFGNVSIEGLDDYPESVARRELRIRPGRTYRRDDIIQSQQRLYESGYFSTVLLAMDPGSTDSLNPDFNLKVRERRPMYATVQTGAAQSDVRDLLWDFSLRLGKRNLFSSRRAELSSSYQFALGKDSRLLNHRYRAKYIQPWFLGIRMPLELTGEWRPEIRSATQDYRISSWSISASTLRKFGRYSAARLSAEYQSVTITGVPPELVDIRAEEEGISGRRKLGLEFQRDSRLNVFVPNQGALFNGSVQYYGGFLGGDEDFAKAEASIARYTVLPPGWISASRLKGGWVNDFGAGTSVPLEDRFYLGGANTVRGFNENSLGPRTGEGTPEGSHVYLVLNQEFRWRTIQILQYIPVLGSIFEEFPLWQSLFFDIGNGFRDWGELQFDDLAFGYGTGFQLISPAGPIRVDYGRRIATERYQAGHRWHFTILYAF